MNNIDIITKKITEIREQGKYMVITQMLPTEFSIVINTLEANGTVSQGSGYISYDIFNNSDSYLDSVLKELDQYLQ